jgi:hypothetical protein
MNMKKKQTQKSLDYFFSRQRVKEKQNGKFLPVVPQAFDWDLESHSL